MQVTEDLGGECFNSLLQRTFIKHHLQAGSMLSHRDFTMCGRTDETRAITVPVASGRRSYGRAVGAQRRHAVLIRRVIHAFIHQCVWCSHVLGTVSMLETQP